VSFAEERFADKADGNARGRSFNRGSQTRTARADDQDVVFMRFVIHSVSPLGS
jgi:hypothetical protein